MDPTIDRFSGLARSSPWRWSSLRYVQERDPSGGQHNRVRVFIRRPHLARVERLDGTLLRVDRGEPQTVTPLSRHGDADPVTLPSPAEVEAEFDADGLVRQRPGRWELSTDMVMVGDYDDLAFLDPVELADGGCAVASGIGCNEPRPGGAATRTSRPGSSPDAQQLVSGEPPRS